MNHPDLILGQSTTVAISPPEEKRWGWFQFPSLRQLADGAIHVAYHMQPDSYEVYTLPDGGRDPKYKELSDSYFSEDHGKSWRPYRDRAPELRKADELLNGIGLANGDRVRISRRNPPVIDGMDLPEPVGTLFSDYEQLRDPGHGYRSADLPDELRYQDLFRLPAGSHEWLQQKAEIVNPHEVGRAVTTANGTVIPVFLEGNVHLSPNGRDLIAIWDGIHTRTGGTLDERWACFAYLSTDGGNTWNLQGIIPYQPDNAFDSYGDLRIGFSEPDFAFINEETLVCVMRTTDGFGPGPTYSAISKDLGKTWSLPRVFAPNGVLPRLLMLDSGPLILASGRPGVQLRVSADDGQSWSAPIDLVPVTMVDVCGDTCGYTRLLASGPDRFFIVYSHFRTKNEDGLDCKAIKVCEVRVETSCTPASDVPQLPDGEVIWERHYHGDTGDRLFREIPRIDGEVNGIVKTWFQTGTLAAESTIRDGKANGPQRIYYPNGQLRRETTFKNNVKHGPETEYNEHGIITRHLYYRGWVPCTRQEFYAGE